MKKITLAISSILLLSSSAFAMDANQVANSIDHVNQAALNKDTQNIQQLQSLINAAKSGQYVNAVIASANFISTTAPQFNAFDNDPTLSNMIHVNGQKSIEELNKALQNVKYLDQFDQHLNSAYDYSQKAAKIAFACLGGLMFWAARLPRQQTSSKAVLSNSVI